jgi:hypothetical protein
MPAELRKAAGDEVLETVTRPLAAKVAAAWTGPYAPALAASTRARKGTDPLLVVGGSRRLLTGGATARDLVYGTEFGGRMDSTRIVNRERMPARRGTRKRSGRVSRAELARQAAAGRPIFRRHSTRQFVPARPAIFPTFRREGPWVFSTWASVLDPFLEQWEAGS